MHYRPLRYLLPPLLLAVAAGPGCSPAPETGLSDGKLGPVARAIIRGEDRFAVADLAQALIQDRADLLLLDLRPVDAFAAEHIEGAESLPLDRLLSQAGLAELPGDRRLVLYAETTAPAAQAAVLLRLAGLDAYALEGGYRHWLDYTTNPQSAADADPQTRAERQAVACYFEGDYVAAAGLAVKTDGGYRPPVTPVGRAEAAAKSDALGLGLGLGLGPASPPEPAPAAEADALGLGLGLGLGPADAPKPAAAPKGKLIIGEGC
jgi:rhodanese-related sulfurtransferase